MCPVGLRCTMTKIRLGYLRKLIREELRVAASVNSSGINGAGKGLYADEDLEAGTVIFKWNPRVDGEYSPEYPNCLSSKESEEFKELASWDGHTWSLAGDGGAYFNHSKEPNVVVDKSDGNRPAKRKRIAARNIHQGEELTMDYSEIGLDSPC